MQFHLYNFVYFEDIELFLWNLAENFCSSTRTMCLIPSQAAVGENKTQGSNPIMSTSFELEIWSNIGIEVDVVLYFTLTAR